jgi:exoribonuclease R
MNAIAQKVREKRIKNGSLIFETPKNTFTLDDHFYPSNVTLVHRFEAHYLIE